MLEKLVEVSVVWFGKRLIEARSKLGRKQDLGDWIIQLVVKEGETDYRDD